MLKDDVASNKAIGSYGASFIQHLLENSKSISMLTHCNTGRYFSWDASFMIWLLHFVVARMGFV